MKPCIECGRLAKGTRCPDCQRAWNARRNASPQRAIYDAGWARHSRERRAEDSFCAICGGDSDLTVDHTTDLVVCRRCHRSEAQGGVRAAHREPVF